MIFFVETKEGTRLQLPVALRWTLQYTVGVPCDGFSVLIPWNGTLPVEPEQWCYVQAEENEEIVFSGVVDECNCMVTEQGRRIQMVGRGMAARLLDNDVLGVEYMTATAEDIIANYVTPFGVTVGERESLPSLSPFSVETGSSAWTVVEQFCGYYGDVVPRFNGKGALLLTSYSDDLVYHVGNDLPITSYWYCLKPYGVCSEVWIRDRVTQAVNVVADQEMVGLGLCRRAVVTTASGHSTWQAREYDGAYRLAQSRKDWLRVEITVPSVQIFQPGALVEVEREDWYGNGVYRLLEVETGVSASGGFTTLLLGER